MKLDHFPSSCIVVMVHVVKVVNSAYTVPPQSQKWRLRSTLASELQISRSWHAAMRSTRSPWDLIRIKPRKRAKFGQQYLSEKAARRRTFIILRNTPNLNTHGQAECIAAARSEGQWRMAASLLYKTCPGPPSNKQNWPQSHTIFKLSESFNISLAIFGDLDDSAHAHASNLKRKSSHVIASQNGGE
jgi:hypothetical protein